MVCCLISELDEFMSILDERLSKKETHPVGLVAKKVRKIGSPSTSVPPINTPGWAVDPEYIKSSKYYGNHLG